MAHDPSKKIDLRNAYLSGLTLEVAAQKVGIPLETAKKWARGAKAEGDDWNRLRSAQLIAGGGIEEVLQRVLAVAISQSEATLEHLRLDADISAMERVQASASLADSITKLTSATRRMMPETDAMAVRLDCLKQLMEFAARNHRDKAGALLEVVEAFGRVLAGGG
jgi:hypothetical protein